jgi:hypothetical protein
MKKFKDENDEFKNFVKDAGNILDTFNLKLNNLNINMTDEEFKKQFKDNNIEIIKEMQNILKNNNFNKKCVDFINFILKKYPPSKPFEKNFDIEKEFEKNPKKVLLKLKTKYNPDNYSKESVEKKAKYLIVLEIASMLNGIYTDLGLVKVTTGLTANVKEKYQLLASDKSQIGVDIEIPKDSALQNFYLGHVDDRLTNADAQGESVDTGITNGTGDTALVYVMQLENGKYKLTAVNVESFLQESEFADGLQVNNHEVSVKVDTSSEKVTTGENVTADVLTVGTNGVKVANIQNAIDYAVSTLDATVTGGTTAGTATNGHIQVVVAEANGKLTGVTVNEANIADASKLTELSGKTVTEIASSNGSITATKSQATDSTSKYDIITDASKIKMSGFTSTDALSGINATSSVTEAFKEVDKVITDNEQIVSAALNDLEATKVDVITVNGKQSKTPASEDVVASVTIDGADIKLDGYASGSSSAAVVATDTVNEAIGKLENQVKAAVAGGLQAVEAGNGVSVSNVANNKQTISVKLKAAETGWENPLKFDNGGLYFDSLDCGTY